jgi:hypothetical protein
MGLIGISFCEVAINEEWFYVSGRMTTREEFVSKLIDDRKKIH